MLRRAVIALVLVLALPAGAAARVPRGFVGVDLSAPVFPVSGQAAAAGLASQFDQMVAAGVENVRVEVNWSAAQPYASFADIPTGLTAPFTNVNGIPTNFSGLDQIVAQAALHGISLLPAIVFAPSWDEAIHGPGTYPMPSSNVPYAAFLTALIDRYGPNGTFWATHSPKLPIRAWQVWNEPNISVFWPQQPFASSYAALLQAAHDAIKAADPGARVVLAGMPNFSWSALASLYRIPGVRNLFDVVALHPYTRTPADVVTILQKVRQVMNRNGDRRKPMIADEISWPSSLGSTTTSEGFDFATTEAGQARNLAKLLPLLARDRRRLRLMGFDYYSWATAEQPGGVAFTYSGLLALRRGRYVRKPALGAFRRGALALEGCRAKGATATICRVGAVKRRHRHHAR